MSRANKTARPRPAKVIEPTAWLWNDPRIRGLALLVLALIAYQQVWHCGYIWDDNFYVTGNSTLRDLRGLGRIWFEVTATPQYYPLVHTSFWLEYHFWGLNPLGFHLVNVILHGLAAILLWRVLVALRVPAAWLAAAIFAVHPVEAESVAWISERKNVLSAVFYFAAALAYFRFARIRETLAVGGRSLYSYLGSLGLFVCALLSKTVTCTLPPALLLVTWWKNGRLRRSDIFPTLPFFAIGLGFGLCTAWIEKHHVGAQGAVWSLTFLERCLIAGRAFWFYAGKLLWPVNLTFIYPRWQISAASAWQWLFPLGAVVVIIILWSARTRVGRGPLVAVLFFAGSLMPALGFVDVFPFRYSFVADHFQYIASVGLIVLGAAWLGRLPRLVPVLVVVALSVLTWRQVGIYRDRETLWMDTVEKNPKSWMAQNNLAIVLMGQGRTDEAVAHLRTALEIDPNNAETNNNLGHELLRMDRADEALPYLQKAAEIEPDRAAAVHYNLGHALLQSGRLAEAISHLRKALEIDHGYVPAQSDLGNALLQTGRIDEAYAQLQQALEKNPNDPGIHFNLANTLLQMGRAEDALSHLEKVLAVQPNNPEAQKNMAWVLATSPDGRLRDGARAVQLAESASRSTQARDPVIDATLAAAYAEAGRYPEAIATAESVRLLADASGNAALAQLVRTELDLFRAGQPFRDIR